MIKSKSNFWEWLGTGILAFGLIIKLIHDFSGQESEIVSLLYSQRELFYWGGLLVFAFGYMFNPKRKNKSVLK